jgi:hypothetical protein
VTAARRRGPTRERVKAIASTASAIAANFFAKRCSICNSPAAQP